uniref:CUB domain-containing protein n=1 Tax=Hucho hucho TaxID=62062 RepID=A0A4W5RBK0_9TELE
MGRAVMVGRGRTGTRLFFLSTLIILLTARSSRAQKGDGCGLSVLGPCSGSLSSLGYPGTYPNHTVCEWEISVPQGRRLHFRLADLDIEENNCQVNYLRIYDGVGPHRTQIVKFCGLGLKVPDLIQSSGNQVTVQFMSGTHQSGRGFSLAYSTTEHTDLITCLDKGIHFTEAEFTRYCPAGCLTSVGEISGTIPHGYRDVSICTLHREGCVCLHAYIQVPVFVCVCGPACVCRRQCMSVCVWQSACPSHCGVQTVPR